MSKLRELIKSPEIQLSLATGITIIVMAYVSKRILQKPFGYLPLAIPPFVVVIYEAVASKFKNLKICTTWYWIVAIFVTTALVILYYTV